MPTTSATAGALGTSPRVSSTPGRPPRGFWRSRSPDPTGSASTHTAPDRLHLCHECRHRAVRVGPFDGAGERTQHAVEAEGADVLEQLVGSRDREPGGGGLLGIRFAELFDAGRADF